MSSTEPPESRDGTSNGSQTVSGPILGLPFQRLLLQNVLTTDALLIIARGLGLLRLISHLLYIYDNPEVTVPEADKVYKNFVIMIGAETREETLVGQNMAELVTTHGGAGAGLQVVNTDKVGVDQRYRHKLRN
jgi:DNA excision repair protein ERCC-4